MRVTTDTGVHMRKTWADPELRRLDLAADADTARFVAISDLHRGVGDGADDFVACRPALMAALRHYLDDGFTLLVLGDAEELWEVPPTRWRDIFRIHDDCYALEAEFHDRGRYHRVFGNHDLPWADAGLVEEHLHGFFPGLVVHEAIVLSIEANGVLQGELQMVHGHQGEFFSDQLRLLSRAFVRDVWATLQRLTRIRSTKFNPMTAPENPRDEAIFYDWAVTRGRTITITGHTHRMVLTDPAEDDLIRGLERHALKLERRLALARRDAQLADQIRLYQSLWADRVRRVGLDGGPPHFRAAFANTGCCCWENGHVSALEIAGGDLATVTWERDDGAFRRRERGRTSLLHALSSTIGGLDDAAWEDRDLRVVVSD